LILTAQVRRLRAELASREEALTEAARQLEHEREQVDELERQLMFQASCETTRDPMSFLRMPNRSTCAAR